VLNHSNVPGNAKLLRLVSATPPRSGGVPRLAAFACLRLNVHVSQPPKPRRPGPPHNPGVRDLVDGKRRWSSPPKIEDAKQGFRGWNERGYLPHRDEPGLTQLEETLGAKGKPALGTAR